MRKSSTPKRPKKISPRHSARPETLSQAAHNAISSSAVMHNPTKSTPYEAELLDLEDQLRMNPLDDANVHLVFQRLRILFSNAPATPSTSISASKSRSRN